MIPFGIPGFSRLRFGRSAVAAAVEEEVVIEAGADNRADAPLISLGTYSVDTTDFTSEAGDPFISGASGASAWWKFTPTETKIYTFAAHRSRELYSAPYIGIYRLVGESLQSVNHRGPDFRSYAVFTVELEADETYYLLLNNTPGGLSTITLTDEPNYYVIQNDSVSYAAHANTRILNITGDFSPDLEILDVSAATRLQALDVQYTLLTELDISNNPHLTYLSVSGLTMGAGTLDAIIADLVEFGKHGGLLELNVDDNTVIPSPTGYAGLAILSSRSWKINAFPGVITDLTATPLSSTTVQLDYANAPQASGHHYRINGGSWTTVPGDKIVTGLSPDTSYVFEVAGSNVWGYGQPSNTANATTLP